MLMPLDLETTGLNPNSDRILEVGWTFLHDTLEPLDPEMHSVLVHPAGTTRDSATWPEVVLEMHTKSGLLDDLLLSALHPKTVLDAELAILDTLAKVKEVTDNEPIYLMGMSVHFDRSFIDRWMPNLAAQLSHRILDVSSIKLFFDAVGWERPWVDLSKQHRAANDVQESIDVTKAYVRRISEIQAEL